MSTAVTISREYVAWLREVRRRERAALLAAAASDTEEPQP